MSSLEITKSDNPLLSNQQVFILAGLLFGLMSNSKAKLLETNNVTKYLMQPNLSNLTNNRYDHIINVNDTGIVINYGDLDQSASLISKKSLQNKTVKDATFPNYVSKKLHLSENKVEENRLVDESSVFGAQQNLLSNPTNNYFNFDDYQFTHRKRRLPFKGHMNINFDNLNTSEQFDKYINWSNRNTSITKRSNANEMKAEKNTNFTNINNSIHENKFDFLILTHNSSKVPFKVNDKLNNKNNSDLWVKFNIFTGEESLLDNLHDSGLKAFYRDDELESLVGDGNPPKENDVPQFILRQREGLKIPEPLINHSVHHDEDECCDPEQAWADDVCEAKARLRIFIGLLIAAAILISIIYYMWNACIVNTCQIADQYHEEEEPESLPNNEDKTS